MFVIQCLRCGTGQVLRTGTHVPTSPIQIANCSVFCHCGLAVVENTEGILQGITE